MTQTSPVGPSGVDVLIGERVHGAMWRAHVTQTQLARAMSLDTAAVNRRLRGRTSWRVTDLLTVAEYLGVAFEELMPTNDELCGPWPLTREKAAAESKWTAARSNHRRSAALGKTDLSQAATKESNGTLRSERAS